MNKDELVQLSDEDLLALKKQMKKSKTFNSFAIGFLVGIFLFGAVSWIINDEKNWFLLIPMAIPVIFVYRMIKNSGKHKDLEEVLRERNLM